MVENIVAEKIEVSERMIRKYKEELEYAGIYIDTLKGPYGGYVLNKDFDIPYLSITSKDIEVIHNACKLITNPNIKQGLIEINSKISLNLNNKENNKKLVFSNNFELNVFNKISNAYKNNLRLEWYIFEKLKKTKEELSIEAPFIFCTPLNKPICFSKDARFSYLRAYREYQLNKFKDVSLQAIRKNLSYLEIEFNEYQMVDLKLMSKK